MLEHIDIGKNGPVILFIHGLGSRKEAWYPQLTLAKKYRLLIPDLRGHGETKISDDISMESFASDLIELLDTKGIKKAYICGLSLGGIIAQEIYKQRPELVEGFILANTTSYIIPFAASGVVEHAVRFYKNNDFVDHIVDRGLFDKRYAKDAKEAFFIRNSYLDSVGAPIGKNYFPLLSKMKQPVLLIGSSHDQVTPIMNMWSMKMFLCHAQVKVFWNTGHLSNIENREGFNQAVDDFIKG